MNKLIDIWHNLYHFSLMIGGILLLTGLITKRFPPKNINLIYGYRTQRSMKNQANWDFAQQFSTREMIRGGWLLVLFSFSGLIYPTSTLGGTVAGLILMTIIFIVMIARTEAQLKRFEKTGKDE